MRKCTIACMLAVASLSASAKDLFEVNVTVAQGPTSSAGFSTLQGMVDAVSNNGLSSFVAGYTPFSPAVGTLSIRGLPAQFRYNAESPILYFSVPSVGINLQFAGADRNASQHLFSEWFKGTGKEALTRILQELVRTSPVDPVAGNPASLMGQMAASDYSTAADSVLPGQVGGEMKGTNYALVGIELGRYTAGGYSQNVTKLPLGWSKGFKGGYEFKLDVPLTYIQTENAKTATVAFGGSLRIPFSDRWAVTPALRVGGVGSQDLGAAAVMYSGSVTSRYVFDAGDLQIGMTNMAGLYRTQSFKHHEYDINYDLSNTMLRNGFDVTGSLPEGWMGAGAVWRAWIIDTRFSGDALYSNSYQEIGVAATQRLGVPALQAVNIDKQTLGLTLLRGQNDLRGVKLNFGYKF